MMSRSKNWLRKLMKSMQMEMFVQVQWLESMESRPIKEICMGQEPWHLPQARTFSRLWKDLVVSLEYQLDLKKANSRARSKTRAKNRTILKEWWICKWILTMHQLPTWLIWLQTLQRAEQKLSQVPLQIKTGAACSPSQVSVWMVRLLGAREVVELRGGLEGMVAAVSNSKIMPRGDEL